jgi:hypothetical protein
MTEPAAAQLRIAAEPGLPLVTLIELRRLTDAALSSPAFVTRKGDGNEAAVDTAGRSVRTHRGGKPTLAHGTQGGGDGTAGAADVLADRSHREGQQ